MAPYYKRKQALTIFVCYDSHEEIDCLCQLAMVKATIYTSKLKQTGLSCLVVSHNYFLQSPSGLYSKERAMSNGQRKKSRLYYSAEPSCPLTWSTLDA